MKTICCATFLIACVFARPEDGSAQQPKNQSTNQRPPATQPAVKQKLTAQNPGAQETSAPAMPVLPDIRNDPDVQAADVAIIANITMKELRFDLVPDPKVDFLGKDKTTTVWHTDRFNLPDEVKPGVTYRNVGIRLKITSRLADIDRIVAEALGEVPINDDAKQPTSIEARESSKPSSTSSLQTMPDVKASAKKPDPKAVEKRPDE